MARRTLLLSVTLILISISVYCFSSNLAEAKGEICPTILKKLLGDASTCEKVKCKSNLKAEDCPEDTTFEEDVDSCGCCPACVRSVDVMELEPCGEGNEAYEECGKKICPIEKKQCGSGLMCSPDSRTCIKLEDDTGELTCNKKLALSKLSPDNPEKLRWTPVCSPDGTYAPRQCKGSRGKLDGACFCVDEAGKRIFGRRKWTEETEKTMDCACSRHVKQLRDKQLLSTIHCSYDGSYEKLQCDGDSGLCYCVDAATGDMSGAVLPESQWKELPCYDSSMGDSYLRRCDSLYLANERIRREAALHGLELENLEKVDCDYDGGFSRYRHRGTIQECLHKNGERILNYQRQASNNAEEMHCNCARTPVDFDTENMTIPTTFPKCNDFGNFELIQTIPSVKAFCVDSDGYEYYSADHTLECCLKNNNGETECDISLIGECYNPVTNIGGVKKCIDVIY